MSDAALSHIVDKVVSDLSLMYSNVRVSKSPDIAVIRAMDNAGREITVDFAVSIKD